MKCPKCQFENPEDMRFCGNCAAKLERICAECGAANPVDFKFCGKCAHDLRVSKPPSPVDYSKPQTYTQTVRPNVYTKTCFWSSNRPLGDYPFEPPLDVTAWVTHLNHSNSSALMTAGVSSIPYLSYIPAGLLGCLAIAAGLFTVFVWGRPLHRRD